MAVVLLLYFAYWLLLGWPEDRSAVDGAPKYSVEEGKMQTVSMEAETTVAL